MRREGNAGALPRAPSGRVSLPEPRLLRMLHDCIFKQCSAAAGGRWGAAPDPAGEDDPPWGPAGCGRCKTYFSSNLPQRQRERWGAAPDPAGEDDPPRTPSIADGIRLILQAVHRSSKENENMTLPGRRTGKRLEISRKTSSLVFSEIPSLLGCPGALLSS